MDHKALKHRLDLRAKQIPAFSVGLIVLLLGVFDGLTLTKAAFTDQQSARDEVKLELSTNGFAPAEVQHAPGLFAIAVENKILSGEYTLRLKADDETVLHEFQVQKGSSAWTVNLPTGRYTLTEVNHPQWTCRITVQ
jgi:hypothetical protein